LNAPRRPPALLTGEPIRLLAPSGPVDRRRFDAGMARLRRLFPDTQWILAENLHHKTGYFAGDDDARAASIRHALLDTEARVLWCARGGYGCTRILGVLDATPLRRDPKLIVGFSDVTALMCWAWVRAGVTSLHAPVVTQAATLHPLDLEATAEWIRGDVPAPLTAESESVCVLSGGRVEGPLVVGNLEVLRALVGTAFMPDLRGTILAIEEVGEQPYRIDRSLTQLISSGALAGVLGVVVGQLTACDDPTDDDERPTAAQVVQERLGRLRVPVFTGAPFGHARHRNAPLPFGARVRLDADDATLYFLEPVTAPREPEPESPPNS